MRDNKGRFIKGHTLLQGIPKTNNTIKKISKAMTEIWQDPDYRKHMSDAHKGQHSSSRTEFKIGDTPWNKNKKLPHKKGINNPAWKGDNASYTAIHIWLKNNFGKASKCDNSKCNKEYKKYEWASISHSYKRDRTDYMELCIPCHRKYDANKGFLANLM